MKTSTARAMLAMMCRDHPFALCPVGADALRREAAGEGGAR